jgi:hypothetical protein
MATSGWTGPFWGSLLHRMRWMEHTHRVASHRLSDCSHVISVPMILVGRQGLISIRELAHSPIKAYWIIRVVKSEDSRHYMPSINNKLNTWKYTISWMMILCHLSGLIRVPGLTFGIMATSGLTGPFWGSLLHRMRWMQHTHRVASHRLSDCKPPAFIKPAYRGHIKPSPTSAPSSGCLLLLSCGWSSTELIFGFIWVINFVANRSYV